MSGLRLTYLIILSLLVYPSVFADTFIVTNTNNTGAGSLRDALEQATRNGTAVTDYIHFNIPANRGPVLIRIPHNNLLPELSSNLVIDGTTQPGPVMGASSAKLTLSLEGNSAASDYFSVFLMNNLTDVSIYGLMIQSLVFDRATSLAPPNAFAIIIHGGNGINIGALNKGNVISGWSKAIFAELTPQTGAVYDLTVQGNILGLSSDGIANSLGSSGGRGPGGTIPAVNEYGIYVGQGNNIMIGGPQQSLGNIIHSQQIDIYCEGIWWFGADSKTTISYNRIGVDRNNNLINTDAGIGIQIHKFFNRFSRNRNNLGILIDHNNIGSRSRQTGIKMDSVMSYFVMENNTIGAEVNGAAPPGGTYGKGIHLFECDMGIIGGENFGRQNIIRYWKDGALICDRTTNITFRYNSTYCNKDRAIELNQWKDYNPSPLRIQPYITINYLNLRDLVMEGTAPPNSWIDLYFDDSCPDCEGLQHVAGMFAVIPVGPTGRWGYSDIPFGRGNFVVTATDAFGATSEYSAPILDTTELVSTAALCKGQGGSVCGLKIVSGTEWEWLDNAGTRVGSDTCLSNVAPGRYYFRLSIGPGYCEKTYSFTIADSVLDIDSTNGVKIINSRCGKANGSISGFLPKNANRWHWEDSSGNIVSTNVDLVNVIAGRYRFRVFNRICDTVTAFYQITDMTPRIDVSNVKIDSTTCGRNNGRITGIQVNNTSFSTIQWKDENGVVVGTTRDLLNMAPGRYKLVLLDAVEGCGDSTNLFTIPAIPSPTLNITAAVVTNATCDQSNGSITGILTSNITAPVVLIWVDEQNNIAGNTLNLSNIKAGRYRLKMKDASSCDTIISSVFEVLNNGAAILDDSSVIIKPTGCAAINGSITGIRIEGANLVQWINTANNNVVGTNPSLFNMPAGNYRLEISNTVYGCTKTSRVYSIGTADPISLNVTQSSTKDATCNTNNGSINITGFDNNRNLFNFTWLRDSIQAISNNLQISDLSPAVYHLIATDTNGCRKAIFKRSIIMQPMPVLDESNVVVSNDTCDFNSGAINGINATSSVGDLTYQWFNGTTAINGSGKILRSVGPGDYHLTITDVNGCQATSRVYTVNQVITALPTPRFDEISIPRYSTAILKVKNRITGTSYELLDAQTGQTIQNNNTGTFNVANVKEDMIFSVRASAGPCVSAIGQVSIKVIDITHLDIPNAFSPNGDGINDQFKIRVTGYFKLDGLKIFNRWGQLVFETRDLSNEWNGTIKGNPLAIGTYYYVIEGLDVEGKRFRRSGSVTLIR